MEGLTDDNNENNARKLPSSDAATSYLTKEMKEELDETFSMASNASGHMPINKLSLALKALGFETSDEDINAFMSGELENFVNRDLFYRIVSYNMMTQTQWAAREMNETFAVYDRDGNGFLDAAELRRIFLKIGENNIDLVEIEDQLREFDLDGDTQVSIHRNHSCHIYSMRLVVLSLHMLNFLLDGDCRIL